MTSTYLAHGVTLAFAWFLIVNGIASVVVMRAARILARGDRSSAFWFGLRISPAMASVAFVAAVFVPSYWRFEPRNTAEGFDLTLTLLAAAAIVLALWTTAQGAKAWLVALRRERVWMAHARPLGVHHGVPVFEIDADAAMMALVGIVRPRLFVTTAITATFSSDEMDAAVAHEVAHWRARDNLKRLAMRSAPDVLALAGAARGIERRWAAAAEHAADREAGGVNPMTRCALASALLKLVRMMPESSMPALWSMGPISTLIGGGDIASRVARLLDERPSGYAPYAAWFRTLAAGAALAVFATYPSWLVSVHEATEALVQSLP